VPANKITPANSRHRLKVKLLRLSNDLTERITPPPKLKPLYSSLLKKVASRSSGLDVWTAVADLLEARSPTISGRSSPTTAELSHSVAKYLEKDWSNKFVGNSLSTLRTVIRNFEAKTQSEKDEFYSRTLVFLQSSGVGKSRLADTFGQSCPMINYVLREEDTQGFPPADDKILSFMKMAPQKAQEAILNSSPKRSQNNDKQYPAARADIIWHHSLALGVLQASFEELHKWVVKNSSLSSLTELAARRHEEMAHNSEGHKRRSTFCQDVAKRAEDIAIKLVGNKNWRRAFDNDKGSAIRLELTAKTGNYLKSLWNAAEKLTKSLELFKLENKDDPLLVVVFDEASSLLKEPGKDNINTGRYVALNRIMSCLREYRIWFFIISTESQVGAIMPPDNIERSDDYAKKNSDRQPYPDSELQLQRVSPFLAFPLNIEDVEAMKNQNELRKPLSDFGTQRHMAMFGRRLWYAYIDDPRGMNLMASQKLIGGVRTRAYDAGNVDHIFAALSFRLSLDACLYNSKAINLVKNAVSSHMRVALAMDHRAGIMHTVSPSEPILANAAMEYLCKETNWSTSILTLVKELIEKGIVEKGLKGELYVRLVLILAHDWIRCREERGNRELRRIRSDQELNSDSYFLRTFAVGDFLRTLYDDCRSFEKIDPSILCARMNFTHFVATHENLRPTILSRLLIDLLRRSAALQLGPVQPTYDILIPIYFGDESKPLDPSECGFIVVQVKNRDEGTTLWAIFGEDFTKVEDSDAISESAPPMPKKRKTTPSSAKEEEAPKDASTDTEKKKKGPIREGPNFVFNKVEKPILFLLFDLGNVRTQGSIAPAIEVSYTSKNNPRVWAIHSRGHGEGVFRCTHLMDCGHTSELFFNASVLGYSEHDQAAKRNDCFYKLDPSFRYPPATKGT
jgi:hypothetical protein